MLDIKFVRENTEKVRESLTNRHYNVSLDGFLASEEERRKVLRKSEELRNERNVVSEEIGKLKLIQAMIGRVWWTYKEREVIK